MLLTRLRLQIALSHPYFSELYASSFTLVYQDFSLSDLTVKLNPTLMITSLFFSVTSFATGHYTYMSQCSFHCGSL